MDAGYAIAASGARNVAPDYDLNVSELRASATPWMLPSFATVNERQKAKYVEKRCRDPADSVELHNMMTAALMNQQCAGLLGVLSICGCSSACTTRFGRSSRASGSCTCNNVVLFVHRSRCPTRNTVLW